MMNEIIKKLRELNLVANGSEPFDAEYMLNELNINFIRLCEEFTLLTEEEQELDTNRATYFGAQQTFHSAGTKLIRRIFNPEQTSEAQTENLSSEQPTQEVDHMGLAEHEQQQTVEQTVAAEIEPQQSIENVAVEQQQFNENVDIVQESHDEEADVVIIDEVIVQPEQISEPMLIDEQNVHKEVSSQSIEEQPRQYTEKDGAVGGDPIASTSTAMQLPVPANDGETIAATAALVQPMAKELPKTMIPYKKYLHMMMPIYALQPIALVNAEAISEIMEAIQAMQERAQRENFSTEHLHMMIIGYVHQLMDATSQALWTWQIEEAQPNLEQLIGFLLKRSRTMEQGGATSESASSDAPGAKKKRKICQMCAREHFLHRCPAFLILNVKQRRNVINDKRLCHNCFSSLHTTNQCSVGPCKSCAPNKHNSLVCFKNEKNR